MEVPLDLQTSIFLKILTFDRTLKERAWPELKIGILYRSQAKDSEKTKDDLVAILKGLKKEEVGGLPLTYSAVGFSSPEELEKTLRSEKIRVLYITPGNGEDIPSIAKISKELKILTITGVAKWVDRGISVGIGLKGRRPQIIINLPSSRAEGADFDARLLKLAKVIRD